MNPARYAREMPHRYRMEAAKCKGCGEVYFPHRLVCRECGGPIARQGGCDVCTVCGSGMCG